MRGARGLTFSILVLVSSALVSAQEKTSEFEPKAFVTERCARCHGEKTQKGDRRFDLLGTERHLGFRESAGHSAFAPTTRRQSAGTRHPWSYDHSRTTRETSKYWQRHRYFWQTRYGEEFAGLVELKHLLLQRKDEVAKCLAEKLLTYAMGRELRLDDRPQVDAIVKSTAAHGYGLRDLINSVVTSRAFRE
jgi:Protein of unknown function (DUF1585)